VVLSLLIRADRKTMMAYPSMQIISVDSGLSVETVKRAIPAIDRKGAAVVLRSYTHQVHRGRNMIRKHNSYDLSCWRRFTEKTDGWCHGDTSQGL